MVSKKYMIAVIAMLIAGASYAQTDHPVSGLDPNSDVPTEEKRVLGYFPSQLSIYYPFGTHGKQSKDYAYNLSLNLVYGKIGKLNGIEVSGLVGVVEGKVNGIQVAGLLNASDAVKGIQVAGLVNATDAVQGMQIAGLVNATDAVQGMQIALLVNATDAVKGLQVAGLVNASDALKGIQVAGLVNASDAVKGIQVAGLVNASDNMKGINICGFVNASDNMKGIQVTGIRNASDHVKGIQIAGFRNTSVDAKNIKISNLRALFDMENNAIPNVKGLQIAGFVNNVDNMTGLQIVGLYNRTNTLRGVQIGLVSVNDTIEKGFSMSLVNIVKRGYYREWEAFVSDYANLAVSYKMGTRKLYTIYTVGANFYDDNLWCFGIGFGNRTPIVNKLDFRPELVSYNYFPTNFKNVQYTFTTHLKLGLVYNISPKVGISLAPSLYVMNITRKPDMEYYNLSPIKPFYTYEKNNNRTTMGFGVSVGVSI